MVVCVGGGGGGGGEWGEGRLVSLKLVKLFPTYHSQY